MRKTSLTLLAVAILVGAALLAVAGSLSGPSRWSPDGLFYQAHSLELRGMSEPAALKTAFQGQLGADLRQVDPTRSGDPGWVAYNAQFYTRRITLPAAAAALNGVAGTRALLDLSLIGYGAALLALLALLLQRFRLPVALGVALVTAFLPPLVDNASVPLTDSWGLALEITAFLCAWLALKDGGNSRWVGGWF